MFYFKYQLTIELIPYVQIEIKEFIKHSENVLLREPKNAPIILKNLNKKINQIDKFYQKNYVDYRTHFILRSRKLLTNFMKENIYILKADKFQQDDNESEEQQIKGEEKIQPIIESEKPKEKPKVVKEEKRQESERKANKSKSQSKNKTMKSSNLVKTVPAEKKEKQKAETSKKKIKTVREEKKVKEFSPKKKTETKEKQMSKEEYIKYLKKKK